MAMAGEWVELPRQLYVTTVCHCDCCGKMVARRFLRQHHQGRPKRFCDEKCARLWHEYWLPRYGQSLEAGRIVLGRAEPANT